MTMFAPETAARFGEDEAHGRGDADDAAALAGLLAALLSTAAGGAAACRFPRAPARCPVQ